MKRLLFYPTTILFGLWFQVIENHFLGGSWFTVQGLLVAAVYWGLAEGPVVGSSMGFAWGLLDDASSMGLLGMHAMLFASAGYVAGMVRRQIDETKPWTQGIFTAALSLAVVVGSSVLDRIFALHPHALRGSTWLEPLWNGLAAPMLFVGFKFWSMLWDMTRKER
jgi:rod shape-determining protein MreD